MKNVMRKKCYLLIIIIAMTSVVCAEIETKPKKRICLHGHEHHKMAKPPHNKSFVDNLNPTSWNRAKLANTIQTQSMQNELKVIKNASRLHEVNTQIDTTQRVHTKGFDANRILKKSD